MIINISIEDFLSIKKPENKSNKYLITLGNAEVMIYREYRESMYRGYMIEKNHVLICTNCRNFNEVKTFIKEKI